MSCTLNDFSLLTFRNFCSAAELRYADSSSSSFLLWQFIFNCLKCNSKIKNFLENEEMEREWGNGERMSKWREIHSLHFLIFSLFPPSLSISYIKKCPIFSQNVKYSTFVANVTRTQHTRYEKTILSRIRCEEAPQVVPAWAPHIFRHCFHIFSICMLG